MQKHNRNINMDDIGLAMDTLTDKQMLQVAEATILPILQDFAEWSSSSFEMEQDDKDIIVVSLRTPNDIEIAGESLRIKFAFSLAVSITITHDNNESILLLTYDCNKMM